MAPVLDIVTCGVPLTCKSNRFPVNPLAALTPKPVPLTLQAFDVVPAGSIRNCGLVVVVVPPVNHVPVSECGGALAEPLVLWIHLAVSVRSPEPSAVRLAGRLDRVSTPAAKVPPDTWISSTAPVLAVVRPSRRAVAMVSPEEPMVPVLALPDRS